MMSWRQDPLLLPSMTIVLERISPSITWNCLEYMFNITAGRSVFTGESFPVMEVIRYVRRRSQMWRDLTTDLISRSPIARWTPVPLRLIVGYGFMEHGLAKLARGPGAFPAILQAIGVPAPHLMGWLTILVEIVGGLAVLLGALVPLASIPMAAVLLVAMVTVHLPYGFSSIKLQAATA